MSRKGLRGSVFAEQLKAKTVLTNGGPVTDYLARGDFEIGIQQTNIMVGVPGTDYVGPLPGFLNKACPSSVALLTTSKEPAAAREMIAFMISREAAPLLPQNARGTCQPVSRLVFLPRRAHLTGPPANFFIAFRAPSNLVRRCAMSACLAA
jgi:hypothetical protein